MAFDDTSGNWGGACPRCGGFGLATDHMSEAEARTLISSLPPGAKFIRGHMTSTCECPVGQRLLEEMKSTEHK